MSETSPITDDKLDLARFIRDRGPHCLIIARHGETEWNAAGRLQGQQDTACNTRGQSQALAAARFLKDVQLVQVHSSPLQRCRETAISIADANIGKPSIIYSEFLKETALGVLEGEMKNQQSTANLTQHYKNFCEDEINYRMPDGENLRDVFARVESFFTKQSQLLEGQEIHLVVGHRNLNKMIVKFLLQLSFEQGFQVEHEHQCMYLYFGTSKELWSCWVEGASSRITQGYATTTSNGYA